VACKWFICVYVGRGRGGGKGGGSASDLLDILMTVVSCSCVNVIVRQELEDCKETVYFRRDCLIVVIVDKRFISLFNCVYCRL